MPLCVCFYLLLVCVCVKPVWEYRAACACGSQRLIMYSPFLFSNLCFETCSLTICGTHRPSRLFKERARIFLFLSFTCWSNILLVCQTFYKRTKDLNSVFHACVASTLLKSHLLICLSLCFEVKVMLFVNTLKCAIC